MAGAVSTHGTNECYIQNVNWELGKEVQALSSSDWGRIYFSSEFKVGHSQTVRNLIVYLAKAILVREQADVTVMQFLFSRHVDSWFPTQQSNENNLKLNALGFGLRQSVVNRTERQQTECLVANGNRWNDSAVQQCPRWLHDATFVCDDLKIKRTVECMANSLVSCSHN
jgi:hypothetical protein